MAKSVAWDPDVCSMIEIFQRIQSVLILWASLLMSLFCCDPTSSLTVVFKLQFDNFFSDFV